MLRGSVDNGEIFTLTNLSWQKFTTPSRDRIVHVCFTDFSYVSKNPKALYLREAISKLKDGLVSFSLYFQFNYKS